MAYDIKFTHRGEKDLHPLPKNVRRRIGKKLIFYASETNPLVFAKRLVNLPPATHRFRVGNYRISFFIKSKTIFVERVSIRGRAYRQT